MTFTIDVPKLDEAADISHIHVQALDDNILMHAKFPTVESLSYFQSWVERDTIEHLHGTDKGVLVARNDADDQVIGFVKWLDYSDGQREEAHVDSEPWPPSVRTRYLESYSDMTLRARVEILGQQSFLHVTYICTRPGWGGQGVGRMLLKGVQDMASAKGIKVILESTASAVPFYQKMGFEARRNVSMTLPGKGADEPTEPYEEECMVWPPQTEASASQAQIRTSSQ